MREFFIFLLLPGLLLFAIPFSGIAQDNNTSESAPDELLEYISEQYQYDQILVNGIMYENRYRQAEGHPFLYGDEYFNGSATIRDKQYKSLKLKYDIYDQRIVVLYEFNQNQLPVIPPVQYVQSFHLNDNYFKQFNFKGHSSKFYQVIAELPNLKCLYTWSKNRSESSHNRQFSSYAFFDSKRKQYILLNDELMRFRNNFSFIRNFPKEYRREVRKYLHNNDIKVHKQSDEAVKQVIKFCDELMASSQE